MQPVLRPFLPCASSLRGLILCVFMGFALAGCFDPLATRLNRKIDEGAAAEALTKAEAELQETEDVALKAQLSLVAAKARLELCVQRQCLQTAASGTVPPLLQPVTTLLVRAQKAQIPAAEKKAPPLTTQDVLRAATARVGVLKPQPEAGLVWFHLMPEYAQNLGGDALFAPALEAARKGDATTAAHLLRGVAADATLPHPAGYMAAYLAALFQNIPGEQESYLIAMRSLTSTTIVPPASAALVPWGVLAATQVSFTGVISPTAMTQQALEQLPRTLREAKVPLFQSERFAAAMAAEVGKNDPLTAATLQRGWAGDAESLTVARQRLALVLDPNQPQLWAAYLPALVRQASRKGQPLPVDLATSGFMLANVTSATAAQLGGELLDTTRQLVAAPAQAVPLIVLAAQLPLSNPQQVQLDKLAQDLLVKAAEMGDVTTTLLLAQAKPQVAQNNRRVVVPVLVQGIRANLRAGQFDAATHMADILNTSLHLNIEYGPILLEEFEADLQKRGVIAGFVADNPTALLQPEEDVRADLGPLYGFLQTYFASQPDILTGQLTTLVAQAGGLYGPATAMYRLGAFFPSSTMPLERRQQWRAQALTAALTEDTRLTGATMVAYAGRLLPLHPGLDVASVLEGAIRRSPTVEDLRTVWKASTPAVRSVARVVHPQFYALMTGVEAMESQKFSVAAESFQALVDPKWRTLADPYLETFFRRLTALGGVYVPAGKPAKGLQPAAILVDPTLTRPDGTLDLTGATLTFVSRMERIAGDEVGSLGRSYGDVRRLVLDVPFSFENSSFELTSDVLAQSPQGLGMAPVYGRVRRLAASIAGGRATLKAYGENPKTPQTYVRALADPHGELRPDGVYLMTARVGVPPAETRFILPPGSLLELASVEETRPVQVDDHAPEGATLVRPVAGRLQHPASRAAIPLEGVFDPQTLTATFTYSYPLPQSSQPVKAVVRCQVLAGRIVCGGHHAHSPREAFAAVTAGVETKESAVVQAARRETLNAASAEDLVKTAMARVVNVSGSSSPTTGMTDASPSLLAPEPQREEGAAQGVSSSSPGGVSPSAIPSATVPFAPAPEGVFIHKTEASPQGVTPTDVSATRPGGAASGDVSSPPPPPAPGVFIHKTTP